MQHAAFLTFRRSVAFQTAELNTHSQAHDPQTQEPFVTLCLFPSRHFVGEIDICLSSHANEMRPLIYPTEPYTQ